MDREMDRDRQKTGRERQRVYIDSPPVELLRSSPPPFASTIPASRANPGFARGDLGSPLPSPRQRRSKENAVDCRCRPLFSLFSTLDSCWIAVFDMFDTRRPPGRNPADQRAFGAAHPRSPADKEENRKEIRKRKNTPRLEIVRSAPPALLPVGRSLLASLSPTPRHRHRHRIARRPDGPLPNLCRREKRKVSVLQRRRPFALPNLGDFPAPALASARFPLAESLRRQTDRQTDPAESSSRKQASLDTGPTQKQI
ncbi:hypothetical protein VTN02DRAFT_294 [Thermoascus thermophilus]